MKNVTCEQMIKHQAPKDTQINQTPHQFVIKNEQFSLQDKGGAL